MIDEVLKIVNKFIPDKTNQAQVELELKRLQIEELKEKGHYVEKLNKAIPLVLPGFLLALLAMFSLNYLSDFIFGIIGREAPIVHIDDRLVDFCKWFVAFLFGKKAVEKFGNKE